MVHAVLQDRVAQRATDVLLADHVGEAQRTVLPREDDVAHGPRM